VTTVTRSDSLPDLPTTGDFVPGYDASIWLGLGVPSLFESCQRDVPKSYCNA
jgi:hypothetical protein